MTVIQNGHRPEPMEPYTPQGIEEVRESGVLPGLVLHVKIAGRDRRVLLTLDALEDHGLTGPAAVELRKIRAAVAALAASERRRSQ